MQRLISPKVNAYIFMGLDILEATSGMGMHLKDIPPMIRERQFRVRSIPLWSSYI